MKGKVIFHIILNSVIMTPKSEIKTATRLLVSNKVAGKSRFSAILMVLNWKISVLWHIFPSTIRLFVIMYSLNSLYVSCFWELYSCEGEPLLMTFYIQKRVIVWKRIFPRKSSLSILFIYTISTLSILFILWLLQGSVSIFFPCNI